MMAILTKKTSLDGLNSLTYQHRERLSEKKRKKKTVTHKMLSQSGEIKFPGL